MKAVWYERQGAPAEVMQVGEQPTPHAVAGEVRVRLHASADVMRRNVSVHGILLNGAPHAARKRAQADIVQLLREGGLAYTVSAVYPLARRAEAHAAVEHAPKHGTVVVDCTT